MKFKAFFWSCILLYALLAVNYYYTQSHPFDPWLQMPPPSLEHYSKVKPTNTLRVLTIGGSTTYNRRLPDDKRYPKVLQHLLQDKYPSTNVEVINAGMDWYTTKHSLINYVTYTRDYQPDVVVIMHAINDLYRSFSPTGKAIGSYKDDWSHFYGPSTNGAAPPTFEEHVYALQLHETLKRWFFKWTYVEEDYAFNQFKSFPEFKRHYATLIDTIRHDGHRVIVVTQPYLLKDNMSATERQKIWFGHENCFYIQGRHKHYPSPASLASALARYNSAAANIAKQHGAILVKGDAALEKTLDNFVDDVHYTPDGAAKLAKAVAETL